MPISGWYEAFAAHPSLGVKSAGQSDTGQSAAFLRQSETEQSATQAGSASVLQELTDWNQKYAEKFGHVFLFCALGRPSEVVLAALKRRCVTRLARLHKCSLSVSAAYAYTRPVQCVTLDSASLLAGSQVLVLMCGLKCLSCCVCDRPMHSCACCSHL